MTPAQQDHTGLLDEFSAYDAAVLGSAPNTVRNHRIYLSAFLRWWAGRRPGLAVADATTVDVSAFLVAEAMRGMSARTRRAELAAVRRLFAWLLLQGVCRDNPAVLVPSPKAAPLHTDVYTPEQVRAILAHTATLTDVRGRQRHAIVATLRYTGMRSGELRTLRRSDLDLAAGRAEVVGKGARQRIVLLPPALIPTLSEFLAEVRPRLPSSPLLLANAHPFVTTPQHGFGTDALAREVELAGFGARVPGRHYPHKWRHTYATELVRAGIDIHVVQRLLGHDHIASTVGYLHLALDDLRSAVSGLWDAA
jgi:site-specific recombinase XerD